jgi:hypothetical protein
MMLLILQHGMAVGQMEKGKKQEVVAVWVVGQWSQKKGMKNAIMWTQYGGGCWR